MNKKRFFILMFAVCLSIIMSACGTTSGIPVLENNAYYQKVGSDQAEQDIKQALTEAKKDLEKLQETRKEDLETTVKKGAVSSATGTVATVVTGRAALGILTGSGPETFSRIQQAKKDKIYFRGNIEKRLREKGYQVKYWK